MLLMMGDYPESKIFARAMYVMRKNLFSSSKNIFPEGHHERIYRFIVY